MGDRMKKLKIIISVFYLITIFYCGNVSAIEFNLNSKNVVLYNLNDNKVLYQKSSKDKTSIASLTKITTAIVAIEKIDDLDKKIVITNNDYKGIRENNLATAGFKVGDTVTYRDLLYGLLFPSGADAAQALANNTYGSTEEFVKQMNKKARDLGLKNTHYVNTTGLDDDNHYSTVNEVAKIFKYALKNKEFRKIISTRKYTTTDAKHTFKSVAEKANDMFDMSYLIGGKTGTTTDAGFCLATIASKNNVNYMLITTGVPIETNNKNTYLDAKTIYEYYINNYDYHKVISKKKEILKLKGKYIKSDYITFKAEKDIKVYLKNDYNKSDLKYKYVGIKTITSKLKKGTKLGKINIYYKNRKLATYDVILRQQPKFSIYKYLITNKLLTAAVLVFLIVLILIMKRKLVRKNNRIKYNK